MKYSAGVFGFSKFLLHINYLHSQARFYTGIWVLRLMVTLNIFDCVILIDKSE